MLIKTARAEIAPLLQAMIEEQQENIKIAADNARVGFDELQPYKSDAQRALIRGINELVGLVEQTDGN